jgi:3-dehydroquinate dehydratase
MSTNSPLSGYSNVNEYTRKLINTKINKATIFTLTVRTQNSGGETTSSRRIQLIAKMNLIDVFSKRMLLTSKTILANTV